MSDTIHIARILVTTDPLRLPQVKKSIESIEFVKIAIAEPDGTLIVTLESPTEVALVQGLTDIQLTPGVARAALCYHHAEKAST